MKNNNFKNIILNDCKKYLSFLQFERNLSNNTINSYWLDLKYYINYLIDNNNINKYSSIKASFLSNYISSLSRLTGNSLQSSSINRIISSIKGFHKFLNINNIMKKDPSRKLLSVKLDEKLPTILSVEEINALIASIDINKKNYIRNNAILSLLYSSGIRVSELINLNLSSLILDEDLIRIIGKGNKERIVPIGSKAKNLLLQYIENDRTTYINKHQTKGIIFLSNRGKAISRKTIWDLVKNLAIKANISKNVTPHTFRHSFASHLLEGGADLRIVQELLGHTNLSTTQIYTHLDKTYLKEIHKEFHPRG